MNVLFFSDYYGRTQIIDEYTYNIIPFKEIRRFIVYRQNMTFLYWVTNLFGNILAFVPLGFYLPILSKYYKSFVKVVVCSFVVSLLIELLQLHFRVGIFDVDDMILNTLGGAIGYILYYVAAKVYTKCKKIKGDTYG